ncbi:actinia tenebrosa protease inhibitors [Octopus bimaculoides]|uniref:BPTI/Kunitz inhibitor domain-containing protein n=1 Tax=Octopus bimaculoides TaxID=37653 RepID=A0A0L8HVI6_OCTBM|nr:actinia tenebrosa protease inhibitors [Octopus bimaculoides]|eukprot:XP_014769053.1 PREDICTED: carboxypeptidase inhibitor SmCI-like [Octopus bimaculoides]
MFQFLIILCFAAQFSNSLANEACELPVNHGRCETSSSERWYFDAKSKTCKKFKFTCGGNRNNFLSYEECIGMCTDVCTLPVGYGTGWASVRRYYFNKKENKCEAFDFAGEGGNRNNFASIEKCQNTCMSVCKLPPVTGLCRALFLRFYYNHKSQKCENFYYGGCGGNRNKFTTIQDCQKACQHFKI